MTGKKLGLLAAFLMTGALAMPVMGQAAPAPTPPANNGGGAGGRGGFNPQRMLDAIKTRMGATDDEFAAIQPKLEKVMQLQRDANGGGGRGGFGGGANGGRRNRGGAAADPNAAPAATPAAAVQQSAVQKAAADLQAVLDNKDSTPADIKTKLDAFRAAKTQAKTDLTAAQTDLQSLLTQRQEAILVEMGMLN
jgi:hypothetical protein